LWFFKLLTSYFNNTSTTINSSVAEIKRRENQWERGGEEACILDIGGKARWEETTGKTKT
jgi:hypothetical protein